MLRPYAVPRPPQWVLAVVLLAAAAAVWPLLPAGLPRDGAVVAADAALTLVLAAGAGRPGSVPRTAWRLLAASQGLSTLAWATWLLLPVVTGSPAAAPGAGDVLFLASYATAVCAVAGLSRASGADRSAVLDALLLATSAGVALWVTVAQPQAVAEGVGLAGRAVSLAYPLLDVLLLAAAVPLVLARTRTPRALLLLGWVLLQLVGDTVYGREVVAGTFAYGTPVFLWWLGSYGLLAGAALHPSPVGSAGTAGWWRRAVLLVGLLPLPGVLVVRLVQGSSRQVGLVGAATVVVTLLAVARASQDGALPPAAERQVRRSLVRLTAGVVVFALVPLGGLTALALTEARSTVDDEVSRRLSGAAALGAEQVTERLAVLTELVAAYADRPSLQQAAASGRAGDAVVEAQVGELAGRSRSYAGAWFADAAGTVRVRTAGASVADGDAAGADWFAPVVRTRTPHVSGAPAVAVPGAPLSVAVSAPVLRDGRVVGVVAVAYRLDALGGSLGRLGRLQEATVTLTDDRGAVLAGPPLPAAAAPAVRAALRGRGGLVPPESDGGSWTAYAPVPASGWAVAAEVPAATAYAPVHRLTGRLVAAATLLAQVLLAGLLLQLSVERRRRAAEARLALREEQVREILDAAGEAFVTVDADGRVLRWNRRAEEVFGHRAEDALGKVATELLVPQGELEASLLRLREAARARPGASSGGEVVLLRADGSTFLAERTVWATQVDGEVTVNAFIRDVTGRTEHEAALAAARDEALRASRMKSEFVANMSHEVRTPMNGVAGMTTLLLDTDLDDRQREFVETLRTSADALLTVINDVLDFSKIEAGKLDIDPTDVELTPLVEDVVQVFAASASLKGLEIAAVVDPSLPRALRADGHRLRQVLSNLVGNAVKFTEHGEVVLSVQAVGPVADGLLPVRFDVRDTGAGIDERAQQGLFEAFAQADASTTRRYGGTGLGLTISRQLVHLMGGELALRSRPGHGSTFSAVLRLPVVEGLPVEVAADLTGVRVLVADDSRTNRTVLEHLLGRWSADVVSVADGRAALAALSGAQRQGRPFGVALLDVRMPGLDGLAVARAAAADPGLAGTRIVLLSSSDAPDEAGAAGVDARLTKPVREKHLLRVVLELVAGARPPAAPATVEVPEQREPVCRGRVLVAEDNAVNQLVVSEMLRMVGFEADVAVDGEQAVRMVRDGDYDAVLMDCQMPVLDGYGATAQIRGLGPEKARVPVVALTASALTSDRELCRAAGMDDFLPKPLRVEELDDVLTRVIAAVVAAGTAG